MLDCHRAALRPYQPYWYPRVAQRVMQLVDFRNLIGGLVLDDDMAPGIDGSLDIIANRTAVPGAGYHGARSSPLPDFYIGAHAAVRGYALLSRDKGRYECQSALNSAPRSARKSAPSGDRLSRPVAA